MLVLASTTYDVIVQQRQQEPHKLLIAFSAYTNGKNLFDISENKSPNTIHCFNGLRAVSVMWIIFGHRVLISAKFSARQSIRSGGLLREVRRHSVHGPSCGC